ncbi:MAG: hypothetical protein FWD97_05595 [Defluviitaleaceae bacterium]|nr:hypothetical protein [Defluviitaleaceae bacterium]
MPEEFNGVPENMYFWMVDTEMAIIQNSINRIEITLAFRYAKEEDGLKNREYLSGKTTLDKLREQLLKAYTDLPETI